MAEFLTPLHFVLVFVIPFLIGGAFLVVAAPQCPELVRRRRPQPRYRRAVYALPRPRFTVRRGRWAAA